MPHVVGHRTSGGKNRLESKNRVVVYPRSHAKAASVFLSSLSIEKRHIINGPAEARKLLGFRRVPAQPVGDSWVRPAAPVDVISDHQTVGWTSALPHRIAAAEFRVPTQVAN